MSTNSLLSYSVYGRYVTRVATETAKSNSRTFLDDFPGLFQDCAGFFLQGLKFNFHYYSFMHPLFVLVIEENFNATHLDF